MINLDAIPLSLYIHFPWCTRKCPYCDFNSHSVRGPIDEAGYLQSLIEDGSHQAPWAMNRPIQTIFCGGGTPSLMSTDTFKQLFEQLSEFYTFSDDVEITMECNPGSLTLAYLKGLLTTSINRLSIGIQSFAADQLKQLGRIHNPNQAHAAIQGALEVGFKRINVDLMHGLSNQTPDQACHDLQQALQYPLQHLSWYQLTIEPNTYFHHHPPPQPDHDSLFAIQQQGQALLQQHGFHHYEISAYEKNQQACRHNLNYWQFGDYIGLGAGAHGKITDSESKRIFRYWNIKHPKHYLEAKAPYQQALKTLAAEQLPMEYMMNALRLYRPCKFDQFERRTGLSKDLLLPRLSSLASEGLVTINKTSFSLTDLGQRFVDDIVVKFID